VTVQKNPEGVGLCQPGVERMRATASIRATLGTQSDLQHQPQRGGPKKPNSQASNFDEPIDAQFRATPLGFWVGGLLPQGYAAFAGAHATAPCGLA